jgi:hypothetical protein
MRDDQIRLLIKSELHHWENISLLRRQQTKLRVDSLIEVVSNPANIVKAMFNKDFMFKKVEEVYTAKAKDYNNKLREQIEKNAVKEKIKI